MLNKYAKFSLIFLIKCVMYSPFKLFGSVKTLASLFEPRHEISDNVVCATSKGSDRPAHMRNLPRAFASCLKII